MHVWIQLLNPLEWRCGNTRCPYIIRAEEQRSRQVLRLDVMGIDDGQCPAARLDDILPDVLSATRASESGPRRLPHVILCFKTP